MKHYFIFISMPMNGLTSEEIETKFEKLKEQAIESAKQFLVDTGHTVLPEFHIADSVMHDDVPVFIKSSSLYCLGYSLQVLSGCDFAYFADGWENARGCRLEHQAAVDYGVTICEDYRKDVEKLK